jgi:hypothetical protein
MSVLQLFVLPAELEDLIEHFVNRHDLQGCRGHGSRDYDDFDLEPKSEILKKLVRDRLFLIPKFPSLDALRSVGPIYPRNLGWTDITVGQLTTSETYPTLTMSSFATESHKDLGFDPSYRLRAFRKFLVKNLGYCFGAKGSGIVADNFRYYNDIGYSPASKQLHDQGVLWKQFTTGNAKFDAG